ncbi:MAG: glycoside hydrolase family 97 N-terminal domain-containing protein, partial [Prevotella sp.]|nr:glycoside hydrolase family 97 N-terminal domain-containing protein [Prevotella sp.]
MMKQLRLVFCLLGWALVVLLPMEAQARQASSPNGMISVSPQGEGYVVQYGERQVLHLPAVGYDAAVAAGLEFDGRVVVDYNMLAGKRLHCYNVANEYHAEIAKGQRMVVRLFDDGVAFRYELTGASVKERKEKTAFLIPEGTKRWMMQWNDAYEGFFPLATTSKVPAVRGADRAAVSQEGYNRRWAFPALLQLNDDVFALLTEANIETGQSAACLYSDGERYTV